MIDLKITKSGYIPTEEDEDQDYSLAGGNVLDHDEGKLLPADVRANLAADDEEDDLENDLNEDFEDDLDGPLLAPHMKEQIAAENGADEPDELLLPTGLERKIQEDE